MALKDLTKEEAIVLLTHIARSLETTEDSNDFCLWLADTLNEEANLNINLESRNNVSNC